MKKAVNEFLTITGLDLREFSQNGADFFDKDGHNALELYKNALEDSYIPKEFRGAAFERFKDLLESFKGLDFSKIPQLNLEIGYKNGELYELENSSIAKLDFSA